MFGVVSLHATSRRVGGASRQALLDGEDTAVDGVCEHAHVVLQDGRTIADNIPAAEHVTFDHPGVVEQAKAVAASGHMGTKDAREITALADAAASSGVPLVVRLGKTETFAVRHVSRSVPGSWAHVQTTDIALPAGSSPQQSARRRSTENVKIQCKVDVAFVDSAFCVLPCRVLRVYCK